MTSANNITTSHFNVNYEWGISNLEVKNRQSQSNSVWTDLVLALGQCGEKCLSIPSTGTTGRVFGMADIVAADLSMVPSSEQIS